MTSDVMRQAAAIEVFAYDTEAKGDPHAVRLAVSLADAERVDRARVRDGRLAWHVVGTFTTVTDLLSGLEYELGVSAVQHGLPVRGGRQAGGPMSDEGTPRGLRVIPVGPDRYCPYCRRRLVEMTEGHMFSQAGKSVVNMVTTVDPMNLPDDDEIEGFLEATCLFRRCRLRRWWNDRKDRR